MLLSLFLDERLQKPCEHPNNMIIIIGLPTTKPLAREEDKEREREEGAEREGDKAEQASVCAYLYLFYDCLGHKWEFIGG